MWSHGHTRRWTLIWIAISLFPSAAFGQEGGADAVAGWHRFVQPVMARGESGLAFFAAEFAGPQPVAVLDPRGFEVHMTRADEPGEEVVHAAGETFAPRGGRWRYWLQGEWSMTPYSMLAVLPSSSRWAGPLPRLLPLALAGRVSLAESPSLASASDLWLLSARSSPPGYEMSRRRPAAEAAQGVLMPAGPALAGAWDRSEERFVALSRPFTVLAEQTLRAPLQQPPPHEAWLVAYVEHPPEVADDSLAGLALSVSHDGKEHPPDFTVTTAWGLYGVWYGLPPGPATLTGGNAGLYLEPQALDLAGGAIERLDATLRQRPILDVSLVLPPLLREKPLTLAVRRLPEGDELAAVELPRKAGRHRFAGLVHGLLEVVLESHVGAFRQRVDLTDRQEASVLLEPELIEVYGTVRLGGEGHPATVELTPGSGDPVQAVADEAGDYRVYALQPLRWVSVRLDGVAQEPWRDLLIPPIRHSRELDLDVPDADVTVRTVDAATGLAIAGAVVAVRNDYLQPLAPGEEDKSDGKGRERMLGLSYTADEDGVVHLPPPRPGRIEIRASSPEYRPMEEPLAVEVGDPPRDRELEILLQRYGERVEVHLRLPDGSPAAAAEVMRVGSLATGVALFTGRADAAGTVQVPVEPAQGLLLLKHPAAGSAVVDWRPWKDETRVDWTFPPAAGRPLAVQVLDTSGEQPARGASLAVWLGDRKLTGAPLLWLLGAAPRADGNGFWTTDRLPAAPVRVLAWGRRLHEEAQAGGLDALATRLVYPWPRRVEVEAVE